MIHPKVIENIKTEMERLQKTIEDYENKFTMKGGSMVETKTGYPMFGSSESGAVKRASLDLSKALVQCRKSFHHQKFV